MERVLVIGCPGAGKSTFARALQGATGLPLYYLDQLFHLPDGSHVSQADFDEGLAAILKAPRWIIDGNYQRTLAPRLARCDTVFLLDYPLSVCLAGAAARIGKAGYALDRTNLRSGIPPVDFRFPNRTTPPALRPIGAI